MRKQPELRYRMAAREALQILLHLLPREWKRRLGVYLGCCDLNWSLEQMKRFGFMPRNVLDVGAFQGEWAKSCLKVYPQAHIMCIEPQEDAQSKLRGLARQHPNLKVIQTLLGSQVSPHIPFQEIGSGSSVLLHPYGNVSTKPMTTIDQLIFGKWLDPPELVKLDVQGYEKEVLKGWVRGFEKCQVIECEISLLPLVTGSPLLPEIIEYLQMRDFVIFDITELIRSPSDGTVWQIDALFCRKDSPLRTDRVWRIEA
jgi:FkbM family methyltransferase